MRRLAITTIIACASTVGFGLTAAALAQAPAPAPAPAPASSGFGGGGPIDITSDSQERAAPQHFIFKGNVEALQADSRLRTPQIDVFYAQKAGAPHAATAGGDVGSIERMEAEGPVYYVTPTQNAKGDHGQYIAADDSIILTGNVILTQGQNVSTGDRLVIHQKSGQAVLTMTPGRRARAVLYPNQPQPAAGAPGAPGAPAPAKPAAAGSATPPRS